MTFSPFPVNQNGSGCEHVRDLDFYKSCAEEKSFEYLLYLELCLEILGSAFYTDIREVWNKNCLLFQYKFWGLYLKPHQERIIHEKLQPTGTHAT